MKILGTSDHKTKDRRGFAAFWGNLKIRSRFDEKKMLGSILRTDADLPEELRKAIRAHYGVDDKERKKSSKKTDSLPSVA
jgi:hypothetical protein